MEKLTQDYFNRELSIKTNTLTGTASKRIGKYFIPIDKSIKDGMDIIFLSDIINIEYGTKKLDNREFPNPEVENQGLDNGGNPHSIFQCEINAKGGWDGYGNAPYNHDVYMTFYPTKDPNNIWYPSLTIFVKACNDEAIDVDDVKGTKWHLTTRSRPDSEWKDVIWEYVGAIGDDFIVTDDIHNKVMEVVNEVTKNGAVACGRLSLILRMSKMGFETKTKQNKILSHMEQNGDISIENNQIRKINKK